MAIQGLRNTTSFDTPNGRRPQNFREAILMLYPNGGGIEKAPLTALTAVMKSESTDDPVYHWFTKQMQDRRLKMNADLAATSGSPVAGDIVNLTVVTPAAYSVKEGDLLMAEQTGEIMYVNATPSTGTTISVIRGFDQTAGTDLLGFDYDGNGINPYLVIVGSAFEEGSAAPDPVSFDPAEIFNQTQIFRATYGITGTAQSVRTRTGPEEAELKREALELFGVDMERAFFFGKKSTSIRNSQPLRTTDGVINYIPSTRRWAPNAGQISMQWLEGICLDLFRFGSTEKMVFCGSAFLTAIAQMVRRNGTGQFELSADIKEYGMTGIKRLKTPNGVLVLKAHPLFSQMQGGTTGSAAYTSMDNAGVILDMRELKYRYLRNRDVKFQTNLQLPGVDSQLAGWIGECGLEVHHPYTHGMITGVREGIADPA